MHKRLRWFTWLLLSMFLTVLCIQAFALTVSIGYPASLDALVNPYMGNAVWASDKPEHAQPFTLVYANLIWADFEPEQGQYDFAAFEEENQFELWRAQGKHLILRFVLDVPTSKKHRDIPDWLYQAMDKDGTAYNISYGRGFSPNYENPILIQAHAQAIAALGERYGDDPFIAYVEMGSLGHWGEWHIHNKVGVMPPETVRDQYTAPYLDAFPNALLLMRRPFAFAAEYGLGLFNDTTGDLKSTESWLDWISNGGDYETPDGTQALVPMAEAWQTAPIGGELATGIKPESLLGENLIQTLSLFQKSHTSWIGPGSFVDITRGGDAQSALDEVNRTVGYRLRVARCDVRETAGGETHITLFWVNDGIAPFYFDWQPVLALEDTYGTVTRLPLNISLIDMLPGQMVRAEVALPKLDTTKEAYTIWVGIVDPTTDEAGVALAMQANQNDLWYELVRLQAQ